MERASFHPSSPTRRFGMRDAWAYARAMPRLTGLRRPKLPFTALARISAMDIRELSPARRFEASDGEQLSYRTYAGPPERQLLLVHGAACFGDHFHFMAARLAKAGMATVHTLDLRGHGQSPPIGRDHERFARDVGEFAAHLKRLPGSPTVIVGGHSAGGGLVVNVARSEYASAVSGWLLLAPFLKIDSDSVRPYFGGWVADIKRTRLAVIALANMLGITRFNDCIIASFDREAFLYDPRFAREWSFASAFGLGPGPIPGKARRQIVGDAPVLLVGGSADECFVAERYAAALVPLAPHGEVKIVEDRGHWDILVDDEVLALCSRWIDENFPVLPAALPDRSRAATA